MLWKWNCFSGHRHWVLVCVFILCPALSWPSLCPLWWYGLTWAQGEWAGPLQAVKHTHMCTHTHILTCMWTCILCQLSECRFTHRLGCRRESRPCCAGTRMVQSCKIKETPAPLLSPQNPYPQRVGARGVPDPGLKSPFLYGPIILICEWYMKMKCIVELWFSQVRYLQRGSWFSQRVSHCPGDAFRYLSVRENQFHEGQDRPAVDSKMPRLTSVWWWGQVSGAGNKKTGRLASAVVKHGTGDSR